MGRIKTYEVGIPSDETWVFEIRAANKKEALSIARAGTYPNGDSPHQIYSLGGASTFVKKRKIPKNLTTPSKQRTILR